MTSPCCGLCSTGTHDALKKKRSQLGAKTIHQTFTANRSQTEKRDGSVSQKCHLSARITSCLLQQQTLFLSISPLLILTHTGGFHCTQQDPAAQQAPSPDSPSRPQPRPSGTGCLASLHLPQSASPAAACRWAPLSEDRAL